MASKTVESLEKEINQLRDKLEQKENELAHLKSVQTVHSDHAGTCNTLRKDDIERYSRQIIIPEIGVKGQLVLKNSSVLIVGVGGLGCPAALYLAGSGIGRLGLIDYDKVEVSNLHRQLLHYEGSVNKTKVASAASALRKLNSRLIIDEFHLQLDSSNALDVIRKFDVVVDATDNVVTRYLLNDACVLLGRPLVSGSALRLEGQLTVYHHNDGPCYRCIFPKPPPPDTVTSCGDGGVLGVVPGTIGVLQALETIKVLLGLPGALAGQLLLFDAENGAFRTVRLRGRNLTCEVCGEVPTITKLIDYEQFCGAKANDKDSGVMLLRKDQRLSALDLRDALALGKPLLLVDVRSPEEFEMCSIPHSINIPMKKLDSADSLKYLQQRIENIRTSCQVDEFPLYVVCRRGNDSQKAVLRLEDNLAELRLEICDLLGGLHSWAHHVDNSFPVY